MSRLAALLTAIALAAFLATPAFAERLDSCAKVDYVEAKDWTVDELERNYCHDIRQWQRGREIVLAETKASKRVVSDYVLQQTAGCDVQAALYERILKNVHKRPLPTCS
jgi:hypothetical protein